MSLSGYDEDRVLTNILLISAVHSLPPKMQVIVGLRMAGYTQQECADIVGMTRSAIGFIYKRAVMKLSRYFTEADKDGMVLDANNA